MTRFIDYDQCVGFDSEIDESGIVVSWCLVLLLWLSFVWLLLVAFAVVTWCFVVGCGGVWWVLVGGGC